MLIYILIMGHFTEVRDVSDMDFEELQDEPTLMQFGPELEELQLSGSLFLLSCVCWFTAHIWSILPRSNMGLSRILNSYRMSPHSYNLAQHWRSYSWVACGSAPTMHAELLLVYARYCQCKICVWVKFWEATKWTWSHPIWPKTWGAIAEWHTCYT